jgi:hypothetical protein
MLDFSVVDVLISTVLTKFKRSQSICSGRGSLQRVLLRHHLWDMRECDRLLRDTVSELASHEAGESPFLTTHETLPHTR